MASSGLSVAKRKHAAPSAAAAATADDPERAFTRAVDRLRHLLDRCAQMRTFSEMKPHLAEMADLVVFFLSDANELAQLYMNSVAFHSLVLKAVQLLVKKSHKRDNQMFKRALEIVFNVLDHYERSLFYRQDQKAFSKMRQRYDRNDTLAYCEIGEALRDIDDHIYPFMYDESDSDDQDDEDGLDAIVQDEDEAMDIEDQYVNEPDDKKDYFETFLVAVLPEMKEHLSSTFEVRQLLAKAGAVGRLQSNRAEVGAFMRGFQVNEDDEDDEEELDELNDGIGLIARQFKMPARDDLTIKYMAHVFKLVYFYFRNVNTDTLLQTRFAKVALLIVTNQRCFSRAYAFKIVRTFLKHGRKDGIDFDLPNSLIGYLLKNFLNDELEAFASQLQSDDSLKRFLACLNKSFIRELVGILNFVEFLDRPLWAFRVVANVKQSLDRLYGSLKQAIKRLIKVKDTAGAGLQAAYSSDHVALLLVQCLKGTAMIVNKLKDFYPTFEEAFEIAEILFSLLRLERENFFGRVTLEFKLAFYQFMCILLNERGIAMNVFLYEYWPKLQHVWLADVLSENQPVNGCLLLISRFCKYMPVYDEFERLEEVIECFSKGLESNASKNADKPVLGHDSLQALFDAVVMCERVRAELKCHSATCKHAKTTPAFERTVETTKRLIGQTLSVFEATPTRAYIQLCVELYRRVFARRELVELFGTEIWIPHIKLLLARVDEVYNEKKIDEIRRFFQPISGPVLLQVLSGAYDQFVETGKHSELDRGQMANFLAVVKILNELQSAEKNKKVARRIAKLDAHFNS